MTTPDTETEGTEAPETTTYEAVIPDEPPMGSVGIDRFGRAWQRLNGLRLQWHSAGPLYSILPDDAVSQMSWSQLLVRRGPIEIVQVGAKRGDTK